MMTKKEKAVFIVETLNHLFPNPEVPLLHKDPFTLLVSVLLSAQCTDERVNKITPSLFALADNPWDMARQSREVVEGIIRPCGLSPAKSKAIVGLSKILIEQYNGAVPDSFEKLEALPGVGHKTASVVMAQAFDVPAFPVDTHIHRLAQRWGLSSGKSVVQTEKDLKKLFAPELWNKLHLQIIFYGRQYCPARGHDPQTCIICAGVAKKKAAK
jgi:endonuclease-3